MKLNFYSFFNKNHGPVKVSPENRMFCTLCKHFEFHLGDTKTLNIADRKIYCSCYPGSQVPITSSQTCRFFKFNIKFKKI